MTSNLLDSHITLLKQHRAIAFKQLRDITSTIKEIDTLLSGDPLTNSTTYTVNDKVISLSAPNKDRVGLVTKVTSSFIHVAPINTRFAPFKKSIDNLAHFPLRGDNDLEIYILRANINPEQLPSSTTSSSIIPSPSSPPYFSASDDSTDTTLSPPSTKFTPSTPKQTSLRRFIPPTQSTLSPTTKSRTKYRSKTTRKTSLARSARCARPDTRPPSRKRPKR